MYPNYKNALISISVHFIKLTKLNLSLLERLLIVKAHVTKNRFSSKICPYNQM